MSRIKPATRVLVALALVAAAAPQTFAGAGPNLVPNPGFETSYVPDPIVDAAFNQPVWPRGWIAEGATELFDHTPNNPHSGQYAAGISGSWSGPRRDCSVQCVDVPSQGKDALYNYATIAPAWRTDLPIAVNGGQAYTFSAWMRLAIPKDGTGAVSRVRWFDANRVPIGSTVGPSLTATGTGANYLTFVNGAFVDKSTDWTFRSATITAPAAARFATIVLGYSDDAWIGSVVFDDVFFG